MATAYIAGEALTAGEVVRFDTTADNTVELTTAITDQAIGIVAVDAASAATVIIDTNGRVTITITGSITRGDYLEPSTTSGSAQSAGTTRTIGTFAIASTGDASGSVTAELLVDAANLPVSIGGDVVGPGSATDNALVRFDLTTGKIVQNSAGILSDAGALSGVTASANIITSDTLAHEQGGLEADVSAFAGLLSINGGTTADNTTWAAIAALLTGTVPHEDGGIEADISAYDGLIRITGGAASNVVSFANLGTALTGQLAVADGGTGLDNSAADGYQRYVGGTPDVIDGSVFVSITTTTIHSFQLTDSTPFDADQVGGPAAQVITYDGETNEGALTGFTTGAGGGGIVVYNETQAEARNVATNGVDKTANTLTFAAGQDVSGWGDNDVLNCDGHNFSSITDGANSQAIYIGDLVSSDATYALIAAIVQDSSTQINAHLFIDPVSAITVSQMDVIVASKNVGRQHFIVPIDTSQRIFYTGVASGAGNQVIRMEVVGYFR